MLEEELLEIYVDGSVIGKSGAVAVKIKEILPNGDESYREFLSRQFSYVKSGQLEIVACTCALDEVANQGFLRGKTRVVIYTDSKYVVENYRRSMFHWVGHGMRMKYEKPALDPREWKSLTKQLKRYSSEFKINVEIKKTQAHSNDEYNKSVDIMAKDAAREPMFLYPKPTSVLSPQKSKKYTKTKGQPGTLMKMNGQQVSIKILNCEYWQKGVWVYKYDVFLDYMSSWAFSEHKIFSKHSLDVGKIYLVRVNMSDNNPWIMEAQEMTDKSKILS